MDIGSEGGEGVNIGTHQSSKRRKLGALTELGHGFVACRAVCFVRMRKLSWRELVHLSQKFGVPLVAAHACRTRPASSALDVEAREGLGETILARAGVPEGVGCDFERLVAQGGARLPNYSSPS